MQKKSKRKAKAAEPAADLIGKRIPFDHAPWNAVSVLAREQMKDIPEITEEAFRDLLKKYGRSADFREALKLSARRARK